MTFISTHLETGKVVECDRGRAVRNIGEQIVAEFENGTKWGELIAYRSEKSLLIWTTRGDA